MAECGVATRHHVSPTSVTIVKCAPPPTPTEAFSCHDIITYMKKILVTGGTGFIGSHTVVELLNAGYDVDIIDNLCNSKASVIDKISEITGKKPTFYQQDLLNQPALDQLFQTNEYYAVMHFAGLKSVSESQVKPYEYHHNNIVSTLNVIKCMLDYKVNRLIFSSSATVYGTQDSPECFESMTTGQGITNPYGRTKYFIEEILKDVSAGHPELSITLLRYFNPIGNHPSGLIGEDPNGIPNNIMPVIIRVAQGKIAKLKVFGNDYDTPDGTGQRDFIHVVDLAKGHIAALKHMQKGVNIYNLGTGTANSVLELIYSFERISGQKIPYEIVDRRPGDLGAVWANPAKANTELGWKTQLTIEDAITDTLKYLKLHQ